MFQKQLGKTYLAFLLLASIFFSTTEAATPDLQLLRAVMANDTPSALTLIAAGAHVNVRSRNGWTPIIFASYSGQLELVQALIRAHCDVNVRSKMGKTALIGAAEFGHLQIVEQLLAAGANPNFAEETQETALVHAAREGYREIVRRLLQSKLRDADRQNALIAAAGHGRLKIVQDLIQSRADVNGANAYGVTPLLVAGHSGQVEVVRLLLAAGAKH